MDLRAVAEALAGLSSRPLRGRFWRAVAEETGDVLDASGTFACGGRYNPPQAFAVLYCSDSEELCLREEAQQGGGPVRVVPIDVSLARVLDLTDAAVRHSLGVTGAELTGEGHGPTRDLGRLARDAGFEAVLTPSALGSGHNLAVFVDRLVAGSRLVPVDALQQRAHA